MTGSNPVSRREATTRDGLPAMPLSDLLRDPTAPDT